jgi:ankyrin repeat protein
MAKDIVSLQSWGRSEALCYACKKGNLSVVNVLLDPGEHSAITTADGQTALQLALERLADPVLRFSYRSYNDLSVTTGDKEEILNLLLDANITKEISNQELIAATQIADYRIRERVLDIMISRLSHPTFQKKASSNSSTMPATYRTVVP